MKYNHRGGLEHYCCKELETLVNDGFVLVIATGWNKLETIPEVHICLKINFDCPMKTPEYIIMSAAKDIKYCPCCGTIFPKIEF